MPKVLLVEDRRENIAFIANNVLKPLGYDVITARDGEIGLAKAEEESPDLIITDLKLPKMHGLDMLEELDRRGVYIPSIVMTFHGTEETAMRALRLGARDYLIKPFTIEEMQQAITRTSKPRAKTDNLNDAARVAELEQELIQVKKQLDARERELKDLSIISEAANRIPDLEQEITRLRTTLSERENQLRQMHKYLASVLKKNTPAKNPPERLAELETQNAQLTEAMTRARSTMDNVERRAAFLQEIVSKQREQLHKYQQETAKMAEALSSLSNSAGDAATELVKQLRNIEVMVIEDDESADIPNRV